jgi:mono/diheme cytochrome c family protein
MKENVFVLLMVTGFLVLSLFGLNIPAKAQEASKTPAALPEEVYKIVSVSCIPCHTSEGGLMSRTKFNFTLWSNYSPEKQKEKAAKMYSELSKGAMPPKTAREKRPDAIPTKEQIEIIKKWAESYPSDIK